MKRIRRRAFLAQAVARSGAVALAVGTAGASRGFPATIARAASTPVARNDTFVVAQGTEPNSLDPCVGTGPFQGIINAVFDGLVQWNAKGEIVPSLATSWSVTPDGRTWTFVLRSGVKFHDGTPFTSAAVKATIDHILDKSTPATRRGNYLLIKDIATPDDRTVRFTTDPPNPDFPLLMADGSAKIVSPAALRTYGQDFGRHPVGTGAFAFEEWVPNDHASALAAPDYWGPKPRVRRFVYRPIPEAAARVVVLKTGEADVVLDLPPADMESLKQQSGLTAQATPAAQIAELEPAQTKPPLHDVRVRRALNMAIDKDAIIRGIMKGYAVPLNSPGIPGIWGSFNFAPVKHDPAEAKRLLAEAGYANGMDLTINITDGRWAGDTQVVQAVQGYWTLIGLRVVVHSMDFATLLVGSSSDPDTRPGAMTSLLKASPYIDYHLYRMYDSAATNVPGTQQRTGYSNPEVDRLLAQERSTFDPAKRLPILKHAQTLVWQDQPLIYLFQMVNLWGARNGTSGYVLLPTGDFVPGPLARRP